MTGIWEFPEIEALAGEFESYFKTNKELARTPNNRTNDLSLSKMVVVGEWGNGTAEVGEDPLQIIFFAGLNTIGNIKASEDPSFTEAAADMKQSMQSNLNRFDAPDSTFDWFPDADFEVVPADLTEGTINLNLGDREGNSVFDLTRLQAIELEEAVEVETRGGAETTEVRATTRVPMDELVEDEEEEQQEEEEFRAAIRRVTATPERFPETVEPTLPQRDLEVIEFPDIHENLRGYADSEDQLSIPAGPETKKVEPREPYDFEYRMGLPGGELRQMDGFTISDQIKFGNPIGISVDINGLGTRFPPANYPRTASYIMNRLHYEGLTYLLDLYRDLVVYSGFISDIYGMSFVPGSYKSFRQFIWRLKEIPDREGPVLIEEVSQQRAAAMGLETKPDHPSIEGEKAPWLEDRVYIDINEDNFQNEVWLNPTEYLYPQD